ncbi:MAG: hypothetical protein ACRDPY_15230 [Streptosporangiaceae bacterium]
MTRLDMTTREWHQLIKAVLPHASTDKDTPTLGAVRLEVGDTALYAVATDRYTLAAERWPLPAADQFRPARAVHLDAKELAASLKLFTFSNDEDPLLTVVIDEAPIPVAIVGQTQTLMHLAVTVQQVGEGTRLVMHDERDPSRDALAGWRKTLHQAVTRARGRDLDGMDLHPKMLARWAAAVRKGERLTVYSGPKANDPLLVTVEQHFAGLWVTSQYLEGPGKARSALPWQAELAATLLDLETGEFEAAKAGELS